MSEPPAETLRRAAKLMRDRAGAASANTDWGARPWRIKACSNDGTGNCLCIVSQGEDKPFMEPQIPPIQYVCDAETEEHAAYIASMHPGVALAVADLLDDEAEWAETTPSHKHFPYLDHVMAIARAYLGEESA